MELLSQVWTSLFWWLAEFSWTHRGDVLHFWKRLRGQPYYVPVCSREVLARDETWQPTGVHFGRNEGIKIEAQGCVLLDARRECFYPDGLPRRQIEAGTALPNAPVGVLLGKLEPEGEVFVIGKKYEGMSPGEGNLALLVNDAHGTYDDNEGVYRVQIWRQISPSQE